MSLSDLQRARDRAKDPNTSPGELAELAAHEYWAVREWVAENENAPEKALEVLAMDEESTIRRAVAANQNCSSALLATLAKDSRDRVRMAVAENPSTPGEALAALAFNESSRIAECTVVNPSTPAMARRHAFFKVLVQAPHSFDLDVWTEEMEGISEMEWGLAIVLAPSHLASRFRPGDAAEKSQALEGTVLAICSDSPRQVESLRRRSAELDPAP